MSRLILTADEVIRKNGKNSFVRKIGKDKYKIHVRRKINGKHIEIRRTIIGNECEAIELFKHLWDKIRTPFPAEYMKLINRRDELYTMFSKEDIKYINELITIEVRLNKLKRY